MTGQSNLGTRAIHWLRDHYPELDNETLVAVEDYLSCARYSNDYDRSHRWRLVADRIGATTADQLREHLVTDTGLPRNRL